MINLAAIFKGKQVSKYSIEQKDAMLELALITMYLDRKVMISESEKLNELAEALGWSSPNELQRLIENKTAKVRKFRKIEDIGEAVFAAMDYRLKTPEAKQDAVQLCEEISLADREQDKSETDFIAKLKIKLKAW
jgi:hypothetical protein